MSRFTGKAALVTGGNSGIGLATAQALLSEGAERVVITGRNQDAIDAAVRELGPRAAGVRCDSTRMDEIDRLGERVRAITPSLDVVFINAGISAFAPVAEITEAHFDELVGSNFKGAVFTTQQLLPLLSDGASVIFCSSAGVHRAIAGAGAAIYVASKAALAAFADVLSTELVGRSIRVNTISPGFTATPLFDKVGMSDEQKQAAAAHFASKTLMNRFASAEEIARGVAFLASSDSSYMTGNELVIDGGYVRA